jgi:hypothetical protein
MSDPVFETFLRELRAELGPYPIALRPLLAADGPDIGEFLYILGVPEELLVESSQIASSVLLRVYGASPVPFHMTVIPPDDAERYFADEYKRTA